MDADSQLLLAMLTPYGIYIYNVLATGLADATDIFETVIHDLLKDLNGVLNIADVMFANFRGPSYVPVDPLSFTRDLYYTRIRRN